MDVEAVAKYEELYLPNVSWEGARGTCPISESLFMSFGIGRMMPAGFISIVLVRLF